MWAALTAIIAKIGASSAVTWLTALIPGGQIAGALAAVVGLVGKFFKALIDGVTVAIANPVVFTIVAIGFCAGVYEGIRWDKHKIEAARREVATMKEQWAQADERNKREIERAKEARNEAEERAKAAEAERARIAGAAARRVRQPAAPATAPAAAGPGVFPFQKLFGQN